MGFSRRAGVPTLDGSIELGPCCSAQPFAFNCRYLSRTLDALRVRGTPANERLIPQLSPLGWDHINLTGDYVWSSNLALDADGYMPLRGGESSHLKTATA